MDSLTQERIVERTQPAARRVFPRHGWVGLVLIAVFWPVNWLLEGSRTAYAFFPLWLGYSLVVDALAYRQNGSSLLSRSGKRYAALFLIASPGWWLFEAVNLRVENWQYAGSGAFSSLEYVLLASLNFSVVMPAVFGAAEWFAGMGWIQRMQRGLIVRKDRVTTLSFFAAGWIMLVLMILWPRIFFPFVWLSVYFIVEPINVWLGNRTLADGAQHGDWRPIISLFAGALFTGFFWEMWNYYSYPKWVYHVPFVDFWRIFEMPLLGYGGYLPFSLELHAIYYFVIGLFGRGQSRYLLPMFTSTDTRSPGDEKETRSGR
ncbi:MAG TPA: hypothetical protein VFF68_02840 [Anaerolineaceae bacterium]|nr:hypothetical protein [Anaerolineaceae bacterium]